jgi:hypothetical protein
MIWLADLLVEWRNDLDTGEKQNRLLLWLIALVLVSAVFTRYDGWIMALLAWLAIAVALVRRRKLGSLTFWMASFFVAAAPLFWFVYNTVAFGDWLYFARGPYSAKAIEMRTALPGYPPHPGWHDPWVSLLFYIKAAEMDAAAAAWGNTLLALGLLGSAWAWLTARRHALAWTLLLALPVPFYAYSVSYGSAALLLQPALRNGTAAGPGAEPGVRCTVLPGRRPGVQAAQVAGAVDERGGCRTLRSGGLERVPDASRTPAGLCRRHQEHCRT